MNHNVRKLTLCVQWRLKSACTSAQSDQESVVGIKKFASLSIQNGPVKIFIRLMNAKSDLNLRGAHMSKGMFSDITCHIEQNQQ